MISLKAAGLNDTEAKCYSALLEKEAWKPAELAIYVGETRTNCYKILDKLVVFGLASKFDLDKKIHYSATNPSHLFELARQQKNEFERQEQQLESTAQELMAQYVKTHEQPGVRFYQGTDELHLIYDDQIKTGEPIYIIRPDYNLDAYDFSFMSEIRHRARRASIPRYAITPDREMAPKNYLQSDPFMLLERTWMRAGAYTAPVEWNVYGDKLAILSFGNEAMGMIIESPQIANAFRDLYKLLAKGLRRSPDYDQLPKLANYMGATGETISS